MDWLVIAVIGVILGSFVCDELRGQFAERRATIDAQRDIAAERFTFQIGGKRSPWFDSTVEIFKSRFNADLIHAYDCCPSCDQWRYTRRCNERMDVAFSERADGFTFGTAYDEADSLARNIWQAELAP